MTVLETQRLALRRLTLDDAVFILGLLNEPSFLRFVGDKGVRTLEDAQDYIRKGPVASYQRFGFGLYAVERMEDRATIGMCGLLQRESLTDPDLGFAFLPRYWGQGYALEAARGVMAYARETLGLTRILAVTSPENQASIHILGRLGLRFERMVRLADDAPEIQLFGTPGA